MSDEKDPDVEKLKEEERTEIPVDEEFEEPEKGKAEPDIVEELGALGRQFAAAVQSVWDSEEMQRFEESIREGVQSFAAEVDEAIQQAKESDTAAKMKEEAVEFKERVETGDFGRKARVGIVQGLNWLSEELGRLAEQFTPPPQEKSPEDIDDSPDSEA